MKKNNIMTQYHYIPIYKFSIYKENRIKFNNSEYIEFDISNKVIK